MQNQPVPVTHEQLIAVLEDILAAVRAHDSFEGSFEYLMPQPPQGHEPVLNAQGDGVVWCTACSIGSKNADMVRQLHAGDPQTTTDGERTDFMVRAAYRVGNSMGQGGMRMIGEMR